jgi:hypothetical protein
MVFPYYAGNPKGLMIRPKRKALTVPITPFLGSRALETVGTVLRTKGR